MSIPLPKKRKRDHKGLETAAIVLGSIDEARKMLFSPVPGFKRGGKVDRTGVYLLHRGERVVRGRRGDRGRR